MSDLLLSQMAVNSASESTVQLRWSFSAFTAKAKGTDQVIINEGTGKGKLQ